MAVRRIPSDAQFVDLGRPEESPLDKLNKLVSGVGSIMSGVSAIREKRSTEHINSIQMLNNVIDRADDPEDLKNIKDRISSLPYNYHNDAVNIASEALSLKYKQADEDFEYMQGLGDEISNFTTKPLSFTDSKGNNIEKTFSELSVEEMMDYSKSYAGTNELKSGLLGNITENMNKIKQLKDAFGRQFGEKRKNPRFKFKNHLGADVNISEFSTISKRYEDQMAIFIDAGLGPSDYLNYEEAQLVKNGDVTGYETKKKQRESEFASYIPRVRKEIDSISQMILDLRGVGDDDELSPEFIAGLGNVLKLVDAEGNPFAAELALKQEGVQPITDVNNMYEQIADNFTTMSKNGIVDYLGGVKKKLEDQEDLNVKAAISWGFGARFGYANVEPDEDALKNMLDKKRKEDEVLGPFVPRSGTPGPFAPLDEGTDEGTVDEETVDEGTGERTWTDTAKDISPYAIPTGLAAYWAKGEKLEDAAKFVANKTKGAYESIRAATSIPNKFIQEFVEDKGKRFSSAIKVMEESEKAINKLKKQIAKINPNVAGGPFRKKQIEKQIDKMTRRVNNIMNNRAHDWAKKWFGKNYTPKQLQSVKYLLSDYKMHNIFKIKNFFAKTLPGGVEALPKGSKLASVLKGGKSYLAFEAGSKIAETVGKTDWGKDVGADSGFWETTAGLGGMAVYEKMRRVFNNPTLRKKFKNYLTNKVGARMATSLAAGGGVFSWATGIVGAGLAINDGIALAKEAYNYATGAEEDIETDEKGNPILYDSAGNRITPSVEQ